MSLSSVTVSINVLECGKVLVDRDIPIPFAGEKDRPRIIHNIDVAGDEHRKKLPELETTRKTAGVGNQYIPPPPSSSSPLYLNGLDCFEGVLPPKYGQRAGLAPNTLNTPMSSVPSSLSPPPDSQKVPLLNRKDIDENMSVIYSPEKGFSWSAVGSNSSVEQGPIRSLSSQILFPREYFFGRNIKVKSPQMSYSQIDSTMLCDGTLDMLDRAHAENFLEQSPATHIEDLENRQKLL